MIRIVLENIVLFLLPSVAYFAYVYLMRSDKVLKPGEHSQIWDDAPIIWLMLAGAVMMLAVTLTFATFEGGTPDQKYIPPYVENGKLVPGHFE